MKPTQGLRIKITSRRHIQGSKIAKRLQNFQVLSKWDYVYEKKSFEKKSHNAEKTGREDPLGFFNIHSVAKLQKNEGGFSWGKKFFEKSRTVPKKWTLWSRPVLYAGNLFGSVPWATRYILASSENFVELLVELF